MVQADIDRATADLCAWAEREEWAMKRLEVLATHLSPVVDTPVLSPAAALDHLPAAVVEPVMVFILEDFFTTRFGADGKINVIDAFLRRRGRRQSATARRYLNALRDSAVSLYEVVDVDRGRSVTVRDLVRGGMPVAVEEMLGSTGVAVRGHVAARVVAAGGRRLFTGVLLLFRRALSLQLQSAFEEMAADLERGIRETTVGDKTADEIRVLAREAMVMTPIFAPALTQFWLADAGGGSALP